MPPVPGGGPVSRIEWTGVTWNPVTGCDRVSPGCDHCYALRLAARLKAMGQPKYQNDGNPATSGPGFAVTTHPGVLAVPLRWREPRLVFVNSMADLFHPAVPDGFIAEVFAVIAAVPASTFQILTKRHARMRALLTRGAFAATVLGLARRHRPGRPDPAWPLRNAWLGVSAEDQKRAQLSIPALLRTPAAVRFVSCEPLLGPIDLRAAVRTMGSERGHGLTMSFIHARGCCARFHGVDWVIAGGESGPGARPMDPDWARRLRDDCAGEGVPFFFKQWGGFTAKAGGRLLDGRTWDQMPTTTAASLREGR